MTMLATMIWGVQRRVQNINAIFLVEHKTIHIQEEEEPVENQIKMVRKQT